MIEQVYKISTGNDKAVEMVIYDENLHYLHMVFNKDEGLPEHFSNSNVYMTSSFPTSETISTMT